MGKKKLAPKPKPPKTKSSLGKMLSAVKDTIPKTTARLKTVVENLKAPHVVVNASPGSGKTSTLVEAVKLIRGLKSDLVPSKEQKVIWDEATKTSKDAKMMFVAFSKAIAKELQRRMPPGTEASTIHSFGYQIIRNNVRGRIDLDTKKRKVKGFVLDQLGLSFEDLYSNTESKTEQKRLSAIRARVEATEKLVGLCKQTLLDFQGPRYSHLVEEMCAQYDIEVPPEKKVEIFEHVKVALLFSMEWDGTIDFNDMIFLPVIKDMKIPQLDCLLVDESQDLNRCQQEIVLRTGGRLIMVGDIRQSIFGFAGADPTSIPRMIELLGSTKRGVVTLPMNLSRRCSRAVVECAKRECKVTDFYAHESNSDGQEVVTDFDNYRPMVQEGHFVLCRTNAPLVRQAFKFILANKRVFITGADIGRQLVKVVESIDASTMDEFKTGVQEWFDSETDKIKGSSASAEIRRITLDDKKESLLLFASNCTSPRELKPKIHQIFKDDGQGIRLSSVHAAKGLEAHTVFILQPKKGGMPHHLAHTAVQLEQELNLRWVAITRAIDTIVWVHELDEGEGDV